MLDYTLPKKKKKKKGGGGVGGDVVGVVETKIRRKQMRVKQVKKMGLGPRITLAGLYCGLMYQELNIESIVTD